MKQATFSFFAIMAMVLFIGGAHANENIIGEVETSWNALGSNDRIVVQRYDDPKVQNASCFISRAVVGGLTGDMGLAEDRSRFSIACRAVGPVKINGDISESEKVWSERQSPIFKVMNVTRMYDKEKNTVLYLVWSKKGIDGSPFSSLSAIVVE